MKIGYLRGLDKRNLDMVVYQRACLWNSCLDRTRGLNAIVQWLIFIYFLLETPSRWAPVVYVSGRVVEDN
jgi:hypothetical protein